MSQYALPLTLPAVFTEDNFIVSDSNRDAWQWVQSRDWPSHALILYGPQGSGKSHLSAIWAAKAGASFAAAQALPAQPQGGSWLIDNIENITDERVLLHWFNYIREQKGRLLMTSSVAPSQLKFTLPDLTSRLLGSAAVAIEQADDDLLAAVMRKQFSDKQMKVDDSVIAYIVPRIERSFAAVEGFVKQLDDAALEQKKSITVPFVKRLLERD